MNIAAHTVSPEEVMAFLDGELTPEEANAVSHHLEECPECAYVAEQFRQTSRGLDNWEIETLPAKARFLPHSLSRKHTTHHGCDRGCSPRLEH